jgi:DNA-binding Lrp family transcriptional regulator
MDSIDTTLLQLLRVNARAPVTELARKLGVTRATVQARLTRLEAQRIIGGYTLVERATDSGVRAHVSVRVSANAQDAVEAALAKMPAVQRLYSVSGSSDLIAMVAEDSTAKLDVALDVIRGFVGVQSTESAILLREKWRRG